MDLDTLLDLLHTVTFIALLTYRALRWLSVW